MRRPHVILLVAGLAAVGLEIGYQIHEGNLRPAPVQAPIHQPIWTTYAKPHQFKPLPDGRVIDDIGNKWSNKNITVCNEVNAQDSGKILLFYEDGKKDFDSDSDEFKQIFLDVVQATTNMEDDSSEDKFGIIGCVETLTLPNTNWSHQFRFFVHKVDGHWSAFQLGVGDSLSTNERDMTREYVNNKLDKP